MQPVSAKSQQNDSATHKLFCQYNVYFTTKKTLNNKDKTHASRKSHAHTDTL